LEPEFEILPEKKFVGKRKIMSLSDNKTRELWQGFMPRRKEIKNNIGSELYSIERYEPLYFRNFNPQKEFEKWAAVEVTDFNSVPTDLETLIITSGLYAVFLYRGAASKGSDMYQYIFGNWLPSSGHKLDNRPHFALMGEKYKNEDPDSEEEIWIPIKMH
jgi:AraC family transcriptional regulator